MKWYGLAFALLVLLACVGGYFLADVESANRGLSGQLEGLYKEDERIVKHLQSMEAELKLGNFEESTRGRPESTPAPLTLRHN
jgi:hypothetical protein